MADDQDKYKMFRNFMVNELKVDRSDIERWTKEAIAVQVTKFVGQVNMEAIIRQVTSQSLNKYEIQNQVATLIAKELSTKIKVTIKE
jgi:hypothetical protein